MRFISLIGFAILGIALCFIAPERTTAQGGRKGFGGFGGFNQDPGARFDGMSNGRTSIPVSEVKTQNMQMLLQFVQEKGITNGMINRQQYIQYNEHVRAKMASGGFGGFGGKGKGQAPAAPGSTPDPNAGGGFKMRKGQGGDANPGSAQAPVSPDLIKQLADSSFKSLDGNADGKLNRDEMPPRLKDRLNRYDKNNDELIDLNEFRDYFAAQLAGGGPGGEDPRNKGVASVIIDDNELDRKVVVFRAGGKTPPGLPSWFKDLDKDPLDAQIAMNEWRAAKKEIDDFKAFDLNDDGLITMEEAAKVSLALTASDKTKSAGGNGEMPNFFKGKNGKNGKFGKGKFGG